MDISETTALITAITGLLAAVTAAIVAILQGAKYAKAQGRIEALHEQGEKTINAKNKQIETLEETAIKNKQECDQRVEEIAKDRDRLWNLLDGLTQ